MFRRLAAVAAASSLLLAVPALAERTHSIGLGFRQTATPIGVRWWVSPQLGIDAGVGVDAEKSVVEIDTNDDFVDDTRVEDTLARWTVNVGTPWAAWSGENVRVLLRPGFEYQSEDDVGSFLVDGARVKLNTFAVSGEVEVELNVWENLTVSASHGLEFRSSKLDLPGQESTWTTGTTGTDFFRLGFFVYLWGAKP